jgi:hypothetical protein
MVSTFSPHSGYERVAGFDHQRREDVPQTNYCGKCVLVIIVISAIASGYLIFRHPRSSKDLSRECLKSSYHSSFSLYAVNNDVTPAYVPIHTTHSLDDVHKKVKYAVVAVHGYGRRGGGHLFPFL